MGKTLAQVAKDQNADPVDAAIAVLRDGDLMIASFNQSDDDVRAFMKRPWVMTSSDSSQGHPRAYGTFARKYEQYVVKEHAISLAQFIRGSSSLTADTLGLVQRGHLRPATTPTWWCSIPGASPRVPPTRSPRCCPKACARCW